MSRLTRIPFMVTHDGITVHCLLWTDRKLNVRLIELSSWPQDNPLFARDMRQKIELLNDLMHADMPFDALTTCRRSPGLFGAILDPAATELENLRAALKGSADAT